MEPNLRFPNNWQGWAKMAVNALGSTVAGYTVGGWKVAGLLFFGNFWGLIQHTPANTALTPMQLQARAAVQAEQRN